MSASLERGLNAWREVIDGTVASYFTSCVHCGLCAEACIFYTETLDPRHTPIYKLEPLRRFWQQEFTLKGKVLRQLGLSKPVTEAELAEWQELVYERCTLCGLCSMVCPVGNDITEMVRRMREGMAVAGYAPTDLVGATTRAVTLGSPMGLSWTTLAAQIRIQEQETGLAIPVEQMGADYMVLFSSMEIAMFPEYLGALAKIFQKAGVSWTIAREAFEGTNSGIQIGVSDLAAKILQRTVVAAERLKIKTVVTPECGHAYYALRWEGANLIGQDLPFQVLHIVELLDQLLASGKLPIREKDDRPLTYHDPCQIARRGGLTEEPRRLLNAVAADFRELNPNGRLNWCCGGGGGVSSIEHAEPIRRTVFHRKKYQLEQAEVKTLVTACANCRIIITDGLEENDMDIEVIGLTELVARHLED